MGFLWLHFCPKTTPNKIDSFRKFSVQSCFFSWINTLFFLRVTFSCLWYNIQLFSLNHWVFFCFIYSTIYPPPPGWRSDRSHWKGHCNGPFIALWRNRVPVGQGHSCWWHRYAGRGNRKPLFCQQSWPSPPDLQAFLEILSTRRLTP